MADKKETVDAYSIQQWYNAGYQIATNAAYYNKLTDMNGDNQGDFDYIFFFADQPKPDVINIYTACKQLKKRNAKGVSDRELKSLLSNFISYTELIFKSVDAAYNVKEYLNANKILPNWDQIVAKREGSAKTAQPSQQYKASFWRRADDFISNIGDTIESYTEVGFDVMSVVLIVVIAIIAVIAVITTWVQDGFGMAIVAAIISAILATIAFYVGAAALFLIKVLMFIPRYFFKSIWWFSAGLTIWFFAAVLPVLNA